METPLLLTEGGKTEQRGAGEGQARPKKPEIVKPYKHDTFELYCLWKSLPAFFKYPPMDRKTKTRPSPAEYMEMMGIEDERVIELVEIKTQTAFAEAFDVHRDQLTEWNKLVAKRDSLEDIRAWAKSLTKNVSMALYNATIRGGLPQHYQLWYKVMEGYVEKQQVEHDYKGVTKISYEVVEDEQTNGNQEEDKQETTPSA